MLVNGKHALAQDFGINTKAPDYVFRFIAIDPGDEHVGLAEFAKVGIDGVWICTWAGEKTPNAFLEWYVEGLRKSRWEFVVVESWRLFPQAAPIYVGSDMPTSRLIGSITALARYLPDDKGWFDEPVEVFFQDPQIKIPTRGWLKRRKLRSVARILKVTGDHASDAELHGYKHLIDANARIHSVVQQDEYWSAGGHKLSTSHALW